MSFEEREKFAKDYTDKTNSNKSALHFMDIHLHNELIDTASLQGIPGILVMLASYISLLYFACKNKDNLFLGITLIIISVGFTDVIFISREQSIFFPLVLILATLMERQCLRKEQ
jgi:O-antigen ligase